MHMAGLHYRCAADEDRTELNVRIDISGSQAAIPLKDSAWLMIWYFIADFA
jgi:hypothetical protein